MNLFEVEIWVKDNDWERYLVVGENNVDAMCRVLDNVKEEEIIDIAANKIDVVDGYKIIVQ